MTKLMSYFGISFLMIILTVSTVSAATYYVRTDGSDSNCNGSANTSSASSPNCAYSSVSRAASIAIAGDNVVIAAGTYKENIAFINGSEQIGVIESDSIPGVHDWTFSNNIFANITGSLFISTPNVHLYNNIFYQSGDNGYAVSFYGGSERLALENNAFIINTATQGLYAQGWNYNALPATVSTISNNYYGSTTYASISQNVLGSNYINGGNPAFVNPAALNFNIQAGSVLIGSGVNLSSLFTNDIAGNIRGASWDIGPYMYKATGAVVIRPPANLRVVTP